MKSCSCFGKSSYVPGFRFLGAAAASVGESMVGINRVGEIMPFVFRVGSGVGVGAMGVDVDTLGADAVEGRCEYHRPEINSKNGKQERT